MKYFKNLTTGDVFAYDETQTPLAGLVPMTHEEVTAHIAPPPQAEPTPDPIKARLDALEAKVGLIERETIERRERI